MIYNFFAQMKAEANAWAAKEYFRVSWSLAMVSILAEMAIAR